MRPNWVVLVIRHAVYLISRIKMLLKDITTDDPPPPVISCPAGVLFGEFQSTVFLSRGQLQLKLRLERLRAKTAAQVRSGSRPMSALDTTKLEFMKSRSLQNIYI